MIEELNGVKRILVVDDEDINRRVMEGLLRTYGFDSVPASSGAEALELLDDGIDLVLLDIMMPDMDGFAVAEAIRAKNGFQDVPIVMVTALSAKEDRLRAVASGANDFISKPIDSTELKVRMASLLKLKEYHDEVKSYQESLEEMVDVKTQALQVAIDNLKEAQTATMEAYNETIVRLASAAEFKDEETANHIMRMSHYSTLIAEGYGLRRDELDLLRRASPMHDVGKIGIPDHILLKPGKLDPHEWEIMKTHAAIGSRILGGSSSDLLEAGSVIAESHHEKWNGQGYPHGLAGEDIPLYGRICAVADVFDALTSKRPYKDPFPNDVALDIIREGRGAHFQERMVDIFFERLDEVFAIQRRFQD